MRSLLPTLVIPLFVSLTACGKGMLALNDTGAPADTGFPDTNDTEDTNDVDTNDTEDTKDTKDTTDTEDTGCPDSDNDGVCNSDDECPGYDDRVDSDSDGFANSCDVCPNDRLNDGDSDSICDSVDDCPGDPSNACGGTVDLFIKADDWADEITWALWLDGDDYPYSPTDSGYFTTDYETFSGTYDAGTGGCVFVDDAYGDGGSTGSVTDATSGVVLVSWAWDDYTTYGDFCFDT